MARSQETIARDLALSINQTDNTWDTIQGPIPDLFIRPVAGQLSISETATEELRLLYSLQFADVITPEEARRALANYGSTPGEGQKASHVQHFFRFTRPTEDITIPVGTLVSNRGGDLLYRTLTAVTMVAASADQHFNAQRQTYEISLRVEAVGFGDRYNLPIRRVNTLLTTIPGIEGTENRSASRGGTPSETLENQANRLRNSLPGVNLGSPGGIARRIFDGLQGRVSDINIVTPSDNEFYRIIDRQALDLYILGNEPTIAEITLEGTPGQTEIFLDNTPVLDVVNLQVNGVEVDHELILDISVETRNSLIANDRIVLEDPLASGDSVVLRYNYNSLLNTIEKEILNEGEAFLFDVDYLLRSFVEVSPIVEAELKVLPSYSFDDILEQALDRLQFIFNFNKHKSFLSPIEVKDDLISNITGIRTLRFIRFKREDSAVSNVEPLIYGKNEISAYNTNLVTIRSSER